MANWLASLFMEQNAVKQAKVALRKEMLAQRLALSPAEKNAWDAHLVHQLKELVQERSVQKLHCFLPMEAEVDLYPFLKWLLAYKITVITPRTLAQRQLEHRLLNNLQSLEDGIFGTRHPGAADVYQGHYDLIVVPGLAYDSQGNRLGYGGGYYDLFLSQHPATFKVAVAYPFQIVEQIPTESTDQKIDLIIAPHS